eukprot:s697_g17.t1
MASWLCSRRLLARKILAPAGSGPKNKICADLHLDKLLMGPELARGGFGKVNSGRLDMGEGWIEVAVKQPLEFNAVAALELRKEAQMTQRCWCKFVPNVFGIIATPWFLLLVMEHAGVSLSVLDAMPHQEFLNALKSMTAALIFMHAQKHIVHLDVKPCNVLTGLKPAATYKLIDFDAAMCIQAPERPIQRKPGNLCYAPASLWLPGYVGSAHLATKTDAYMLGKCFQELATKTTEKSPSDDVTEMLGSLVQEDERLRPSLQDFSHDLGKPAGATWETVLYLASSSSPLRSEYFPSPAMPISPKEFQLLPGSGVHRTTGLLPPAFLAPWSRPSVADVGAESSVFPGFFPGLQMRSETCFGAAALPNLPSSRHSKCSAQDDGVQRLCVGSRWNAWTVMDCDSGSPETRFAEPRNLLYDTMSGQTKRDAAEAFGQQLPALGDLTLAELTAVAPVDGRYRKNTKGLAEYFSEYGLIRYRVHVEIEYFLALMGTLPMGHDLPSTAAAQLREIPAQLTLENAQEIKDTEKVTNHDVKAVEYFIKKRFDELGLEKYKEWVHFALTSQDINNTATPMLMRDAIHRSYIPSMEALVETLRGKLPDWDMPMLAKTHGQPASPTNLAKEFKVFIERIESQLKLLKQVPHSCKFGGATGNMNAHLVTFPEVDWRSFANKFCTEHLGLERQQYTTQIEHYDNMGAIFDGIKRLNTILLDLCKDVWMYVSMEYFKQKIVAGEVGSSAMPHKVNPIDFENAEGNLGFANAMLEHLAQKLPVSRLQRDLTDSTVLRNVGLPLAHTAIALASIQRGLGKLLVNKAAVEADLESNWAVVAEAIQSILRREGYPKPYEALRDLTRTNEAMTKERIHNFVDTLKVDDKIKAELKKVTPYNYVGYS